MKGYQLAKQDLWQGREVRPEDGVQYYYQAVRVADANELSVRPERVQVGLVGYVCEEGVRRNQGRLGAAGGPDAFRSRMSKLAFHHSDLEVLDVGNVVCEGGDMEGCQNSLAELVTGLMDKEIFPVIVGGGHDIAYGHFKGIYDAVNGGDVVQDSGEKRIGIINFDAHFDLRPVELAPSSGTPFQQILAEHQAVNYFVIGIQRQSNTRQLYEIAADKQVQFVESQDSVCSHLPRLKPLLAEFLERNDYIYITIDLDGFSSGVAPGVSAPSPLGFSPLFVQEVLQFLFRSGKVISCDLAELNPKFDVDNSTANLAARMVDFIIQGCVSAHAQDR